jgi:penicillin-binding protein 1A
MREIKGFLKDAMKRTDRYRQLMEEMDGDEDKVWEVLKKPVRMTVFSWQGEKDTTLSPLDSLNYYKRILNAGFMAMDPNNGHVKAWVGGINFKYFKYDHVRQSKRQPGSTFKPFVYASAIESDIVTPCDYVVDEPVTFGQEDGIMKSWTPQNSDGKYSYQSMSLRRAMARSINTVSAKLMKQLEASKSSRVCSPSWYYKSFERNTSLMFGCQRGLNI